MFGVLPHRLGLNWRPAVGMFQWSQRLAPNKGLINFLQEDSDVMFNQKVEWEYGEKYGHVYYPENFDDFQKKLYELDLSASTAGKPFYVEIYFDDGNYLGLIVGHQLSCFAFGVLVSNDDVGEYAQMSFDSHCNKDDMSETSFVLYSFKGDYGETPLEQTIPKEQAIKALEYYVEYQKFPSFISFSKQEIIDKYIEKSG